MKTATLTIISLALTLSACVSDSIGGGATYNAANTDSTSYYSLCLRAANSGTKSKEDNQEFYKNCLHHYGLATEDNGVVVKGAGRDTSRIGAADQRGGDALKNNTRA
jgi:hypothetical protein